jgi:thioredoxin-related protein
VGVLKKPEVTAKYSQHFLGAHADFGELELDDKDPLHEMVKRHNPQKLRPVIVFLDATGKEVARHRGKLEVEDALLLDRYVAEKQYQKGGDFAAFRKSRKG